MDPCHFSPCAVPDFDRSPFSGLSKEISTSVTNILLSSPSSGHYLTLFQAWNVPMSPQSPLREANPLCNASAFDLPSSSSGASGGATQAPSATTPSTSSPVNEIHASIISQKGQSEGEPINRAEVETEGDSGMSQGSTGVGEAAVEKKPLTWSPPRWVRVMPPLQKPDQLDLRVVCSSLAEAEAGVEEHSGRGAVAIERGEGTQECHSAFRTYSPMGGKPPRPPKKPNRSLSMGDVSGGLAEMERKIEAAKKELHAKRRLTSGQCGAGLKGASGKGSNGSSNVVLWVLLGALFLILVLFQGMCASEQSSVFASESRNQTAEGRFPSVSSTPIALPDAELPPQAGTFFLLRKFGPRPIIGRGQFDAIGESIPWEVETLKDAMKK